MSTPLLEVHDLKKHFPIRAGFLGGVTASAGTSSTAIQLGLRHRF